MKIKFTWKNSYKTYECDAKSKKEALLKALDDGVNLNYINLYHVNLEGIDLSHVDLRFADLRYTNLRNSNLYDALLEGVSMHYTKLNNANLSRADLTHSHIHHTNFENSNLFKAKLIDASISQCKFNNANLKNVDWYGSAFYLNDLTGAKLNKIPIVKNLDKRILDAINEGGSLNMNTWHDILCDSTHCRAGWAVHLAGEKGYNLEAEFGACVAGALIYHASTGRVPNFYANQENALKDIRKCALKKK